MQKMQHLFIIIPLINRTKNPCNIPQPLHADANSTHHTSPFLNTVYDDVLLCIPHTSFHTFQY